MQKSMKNLVDELGHDVKTLVESKVSLYKIEAFERGVPAGINTAYFIILIILLLFAVGLLLTAASVAVATLFVTEATELLKGLSLGFVSVGAGVLVILIIMSLVRRKVVSAQYNKMLTIFLDKMDEEERMKQEIDVEVPNVNTTGYEQH